MKMKIEKKDLLIFLVFLILVLVFFYPFLSGSQVFAFKDLSRYFYPLRYLMVEQVKAGHLPLWNPYIFCGMPFLATLQICFFYPLTLIYYLLPFNLAFNYYIILHYFLAAGFMYLLMRHYEQSRRTSVFTGIVFAFSGYLLSVSNMNTSLSSVIWLPLAVLFYDRLIKEQRFLNLAVLGILLAVQFLGGEPTIIYLTLWFLFFYGILFSDRSWKKFFRNLRGLFFSGLIALGLIVVQLLPFLELVRLSDRVMNIHFELISMRSFPPRELLTFIFPYFFGNPSLFGNYSEDLLGKTLQDWLITPYFGIIPLVFVFLSFRKNRLFYIYSFAALGSLILAFGRYTFLYRFFYQFMPGISLIRYPVKYLFLTNFSLVVLSGFGFENLLNLIDKGKNKIKPIFISLLFIFIVFALIALLSFLFAGRIYQLLIQGFSKDLSASFVFRLVQIIRFNLRSGINVAAYFFIFLLALGLVYFGRIKKSIFIGILVLVTIADLFSSGVSIAVPLDVQVYKEVPENFRILSKEKGRYRVFYTPEVERQNRMAYGVNYYNATLDAKDNFAANWHIPYHFYDFYGYESIKPKAMFGFYHLKFKEEMLDKNLKYLSFFNVKYIFSIKELKGLNLKLLRRKKIFDQVLYLYENPKAFPRAYLLDAENRPKKGKVEILKYSPVEIEIEAVARESGHLFLSDAYYPGWKVWVDGKPSRIERANYIFRSVKLSPGKHLVRFVYDPLSFKIGAIVSLLTLFGLALGGIRAFVKNRQA